MRAEHEVGDCETLFYAELFLDPILGNMLRKKVQTASNLIGEEFWGSIRSLRVG